MGACTGLALWPDLDTRVDELRHRGVTLGNPHRGVPLDRDFCTGHDLIKDSWGYD